MNIPDIKTGPDGLTILTDEVIQSLARHIAMDIDELSDILASHAVTIQQGMDLTQNPYFNKVLDEERRTWKATKSTSERIKWKSLALIEQSLPELFARLHDKDESLLHKSNLLNTFSKFAGIAAASPEGSTDKVSITINLGEQKQLKVEHKMPVINDVSYTDETSDN